MYFHLGICFPVCLGLFQQRLRWNAQKWELPLRPWHFMLKPATWSSFSLLCCITAIRSGNSKVTKTPGFTRLPSLVAEKAWGFRSHSYPHLPMISHYGFPFSVLLLLLNMAMKGEKTFSLMPVAFPRGKKMGIFIRCWIVLKSETQKC